MKHIQTSPIGLPYARAHTDGTPRVTCPACGKDQRDIATYQKHFLAQQKVGK